MNNVAASNDFWDVLIPGDDAWPRASAAIPELNSIVIALSEEDQAWLQAAAKCVLAAPQRVIAMQSLQCDAPAAFGRILKALYESYYNTAVVHAMIERLAEIGPRELSDSFDETMLRQVVRSEAGKLRACAEAEDIVNVADSMNGRSTAADSGNADQTT